MRAKGAVKHQLSSRRLCLFGLDIALIRVVPFLVPDFWSWCSPAHVIANVLVIWEKLLVQLNNAANNQIRGNLQHHALFTSSILLPQRGTFLLVFHCIFVNSNIDRSTYLNGLRRFFVALNRTRGEVSIEYSLTRVGGVRLFSIPIAGITAAR